MLCTICSKLAIIYLKKTCMKCQLPINQNILVLCDECSKQSKSCAACLRKIGPSRTIKDCGCNKK